MKLPATLPTNDRPIAAGAGQRSDDATINATAGTPNGCREIIAARKMPGPRKPESVKRSSMESVSSEPRRLANKQHRGRGQHRPKDCQLQSVHTTTGGLCADLLALGIISWAHQDISR